MEIRLVYVVALFRYRFYKGNFESESLFEDNVIHLLYYRNRIDHTIGHYHKNL